jgi:hypothetical protein
VVPAAELRDAAAERRDAGVLDVAAILEPPTAW